MSILYQIEVLCGDVRDVAADLLVLKYADGLYGADFAVADRLGVHVEVPKGRSKLVEGSTRTKPGIGVKAHNVVFFGVGPLFDFRYQNIRAFSAAMLQDIGSAQHAPKVIATTIHGPGYGLDEREAFTSQLQGYLDFTASGGTYPEKIIIVERDEQRAYRLSRVLEDFKMSDPGAFADLLTQDFSPNTKPVPSEPLPNPLDSEHANGTTRVAPTAPLLPPEKPKLFAAMPFAEKYMDEYDIAFVEAAHAHGFICERLDLENYVGDVIDEVFSRIRNSAGVVALLNDNNPNVFLEVGYAMAIDKPVILVAQTDQDIAFDLRSQRRQTYSRIAELRRDMTALIGDLKADGTLAPLR